MIHPTQLLNDLKALMRRLETDMRERCDDVPSVNDALAAEHQHARQKGRTAQTFDAWRDEIITQGAAAWILACVFVRFMEDNGLMEEALIAGPGERLQRARDARTLYFQTYSRHSDREYLEHVFQRAAALPAVDALFDQRLWQIGPTGDGANALLRFFQTIDAASGHLKHDFSDPAWDARFLGDLYQDLSESIRKKYALLQTPAFVEQFILDRTLTPALDVFGLPAVRLIDPACGSGHFLIGAFQRLLHLWREQAPAVNERELAQRALNAIYGVDINPQAAAIARFRLLIAALKASGIQKLKNAPGFKIHIAVGDSLLHGPKPGHLPFSKHQKMAARQMPFENQDPIAHVYANEDADKLRRYLGRRFHVVVGNPPYITVKDKAINKEYRDIFGSCYQKYSLAVPFMERIFDLAEHGDPAGFVGMITSNAFMKRTFGKTLIEKYIPKWDLTHIIDTSGVHIPGHGTPTVILLGRNQKPVSNTIRSVLGIKGEPSVPKDPGKGEVWTSILNGIDVVHFENEYISVSDLDASKFYTHPWNITGGRALLVKDAIDQTKHTVLRELVENIGITSVTGEDELYIIDELCAKRFKLERIKKLVIGDKIRDYSINNPDNAIWVYDDDFNLLPLKDIKQISRRFWLNKAIISKRKKFGVPMMDKGLSWYEWQELYSNKLMTSLFISFAFVATHNHFVLDRGGKVFNRSAPVIKLPAEASIDDHLKLMGLLNSSTALFWARQTLFSKRGDPVGRWGEFVEWDGTKLKQFPIPDQTPLELARQLDALGQEITQYMPAHFIKLETPSQARLDAMARRFTQARERMIALQEELDWQCYYFYRITTEKLWAPNADGVPRIQLGRRAFEIHMARQMAAGELESAWFERHGATPATAIPPDWPQAYRDLVNARIRLMETDKHIGLMEQPEYKRRWAVEPWDKQVRSALEAWLLNRLEYVLSGRDLMAETEPREAAREPALLSCAHLADQVRDDDDFLQAAQLYTGQPGFDPARLVETLVAGQAVPFLPRLRYKPSGLRKRRDWERTWELQRREDAIDARIQLPEDHPDYLDAAAAARLKSESVGAIPVPPKYQPKDFAKPVYWKLRGKLDVPRERFISYPGLEKEPGKGMVICWAGWDHLQQARALAGYLEEAKAEGRPERQLQLMLAGLADLLPWLKQWCNEIDPAHGVGLGDFFANYVESESRALGLSMAALKDDDG